MPGPGQGRGQQDQQARHHQKDGQHAQHNALGQHDADVVADGKAHEDQRNHPRHGGQGAGSHRHEGIGQRPGHGPDWGQALVQPGVVGVDQHDGIVHRQRQLQDRRHGEGDKGNRGKDQVRPHVQHDGDGDDRHKDQGL